jgi:hypothetical protein
MTPLENIIADHVWSHRSLHVDRRLGVAWMPEGYALMIDWGEEYFYWLRSDGIQGPLDRNKWAVYRSAKNDAKVWKGSEHAQE